MTERDPQLQELIDRQAIRDALMRYCRGVDRIDADLIGSAYHDDATDQHSTRDFAGSGIGPGLAEWVGTSTTHSTHQITNQSFCIQGDTAGCESYYVVWQVEAHDGVERTLFSAGRYLDRFERRNGEWKIAARTTVVEIVRYLAPGDDISGVPALGRRDYSDPSYELLSGRRGHQGPSHGASVPDRGTQ